MLCGPALGRSEQADFAGELAQPPLEVVAQRLIAAVVSQPEDRLRQIDVARAVEQVQRLNRQRARMIGPARVAGDGGGQQCSPAIVVRIQRQRQQQPVTALDDVPVVGVIRLTEQQAVGVVAQLISGTGEVEETVGAEGRGPDGVEVVAVAQRLGRCGAREAKEQTGRKDEGEGEAGEGGDTKRDRADKEQASLVRIGHCQ